MRTPANLARITSICCLGALFLAVPAKAVVIDVGTFHHGLDQDQIAPFGTSWEVNSIWDVQFGFTPQQVASGDTVKATVMFSDQHLLFLPGLSGKTREGYDQTHFVFSDGLGNVSGSWIQTLTFFTPSGEFVLSGSAGGGSQWLGSGLGIFDVPDDGLAITALEYQVTPSFSGAARSIDHFRVRLGGVDMSVLEPPPSGVPDAGSALLLLGLSIAGMAVSRRFLRH